MAMNALSDRSANYLSQRSADVILSEIRPTKLAPEAVRSINVFLDELLWSILSSARSFSTDRLKSALGKILPSSLGKDAVLEAEMELKSYLERTASTNGATKPYTENVQDFPLHAAFELLRLKCEAYSTLNDSDEDTDAENRWQTKIIDQAGFPTHNTHYMASCALYVTAIIECACEHILSNISRVTSRDSSRSTASLQDLFVALCEDPAIYGTFKSMKVYSQIEAQSRALSSPRRSRSIQRDGGSHSRFPSLAASTPGSEVDLHGGISKARQSSDSGGSGHAIAAAQSTSSRSSTEKSRAKKLFGRTSADKEGSQTGGDTGHKRNESFISSGRRSVTPFDDGPGSSPSATELEFDELMRSGTTMKVSLTPDRLRTFETHKGQQRRQGLSTATNLPLNGKAELGIEEVTVMDGNDISSLKNGISVLPSRPAVPRSVDSILEDDENGGISGVGGDKVSVRLRKESKGAPPAPVVTASARSRSKSASATPSTLGANSGLMRKSSLNALGHNLPTLPPMPKMFSDSDGMPIRKRPKASRKDSIDEILGSSDDDDELMKSSFRPKAAQSNGVSSRDLISFLNDGPPDFGPTPSIASTQSQANEGRAKQGRFRSMVSKLTRGGSTEKLVSNHGVGSDALNPPKKSTSSNHPPPSFIPPPLSAKKSLHSISSFPLSADKPFSSAPTTLTLPPPSPGKSFSESISMSPSRTRISPVTTRKAVPVFDLGSQRPSSSAPPPTPLQKETTPISPAKEEPSIRVSPVKSQSNVSIKQQDTVPQAKSNADTKAMFTTATTTTMKERRSSVQSRPADIIISKAREEEKSDVPPAIRPKRTSSIDGGLPSPTWQKLSPMSKSTQRHALTPPATPSSSVFAAHAKDMRRLMASASNADECRLLVDMFLAQAGFPVRPTDFHSDPQKEPSDHQQASVVAALLGHDDIPSEQIPTREAINTSHSASESSLPTPRSPVHSPAPSLSRKALPGEVHNLVSPVVVLAEA